MFRTFIFIQIAFILLVACTAAPTATPVPTNAPTATATMQPTSTPLPTQTPIPTATRTPTAIATRAPAILGGYLFLDANGNGLRDNASFVCPDASAIPPSLAYYFPSAKCTPGQLVTVMEPGLAGYLLNATVNGQPITATTDANGNYRMVIPGGTDGQTVKMNVADSNAKDVALATRYINQWNKQVTVPAYEMNGVKVPEQRLNDTTTFPIAQGFTAKVGTENKTGFMQGFLTLPWLCKQYPEVHIFNYFDILGDRFMTGAPYNSFVDGKKLSYDGRYSTKFGSNLGDTPPKPGVEDPHNGVDFFVPIGNFVVAGTPNGNIHLWQEDKGDLITVTKYQIGTYLYSSGYGHQSERFLSPTKPFLRTQVLGVSSNTGTNSGGYQQIHFDVYIREPGGCCYFLDPFRSLVPPTSIGNAVYWGNPVSMWTIDNVPVFSDACNN